MSTSASLAMAAKARELKSEGRDIIGLVLENLILTLLSLLKMLQNKPLTTTITPTPLSMDMLN